MNQIETNCKECDRIIIVDSNSEDDDLCLECYQEASKLDQEIDIKLEDRHETRN